MIAAIVPSSEGMTRTAFTGSTAAWVDGDSLGLFAPQASPAAGVNVKYTVSGVASTPVWAASPTLYWRDPTSLHRFLGYAPYASGNSDTTAIKIPALSSQNGTLRSTQDFLISNNQRLGVARGSGSVPLAFTHAFALIEFKFQIGNGVLAGTTLTGFTFAGAAAEKLFTTDNTSTISLPTGAITAGAGTTNTITVTPVSPPTLTTSPSAAYYMMLLPGTYTGPTLAVTIRDGGTTAYTTAASSVGTTKFDPGKKYTYTVTVSRSVITISPVTITDWTTVNGGTLTPGIS